MQSKTRPKYDEGVSLLSRLLAAYLPPELERRAEICLGLVGVGAFRSRRPGAPPLIGIVGSASCGKSTLFNSIPGAPIAAVTPIPHQTTGPIILAPKSFAESLEDPAFLRPLVERIDREAGDAANLTGSPEKAVALCRDDRPFILIDLPDIGTVESDEEKQLAVRILPWLDRVILMLTEESFAQAAHEAVQETLQEIHPDRARAEQYVVLNRRHAATSDAEFAARLETVRGLWPNASLSTLPHLADGESFAAADIDPLIAEASGRNQRMLAEALGNVAREVAEQVSTLADARRTELRRLELAADDEIRREARFRNAFFSSEFRKRLDSFSPWRASLGKMRSLFGNQPEVSIDALLAAEPVVRHATEIATQVRSMLHRRLARLYDDASFDIPAPDEAALRKAVEAVVAKTNERARRDVEALLAGLREDRKLKSPLWTVTTGVAAALFLGDLVLPGVGSATSAALLGLLSALGLSKSVHAEIMQRVRTSRVREAFEDDLRQVVRRACEPLLQAASPGGGDLQELAKQLTQWAREKSRR
ncbi:MAG: GTPase [Candidatus Lernaella stagnicola]|nr:GTPase [Candidatus Lernaella stagnicola]